MRESIFGVGLQAKSINVSAQRRLNLYLEFRPEEDGIRVVAQGTPGLTAPLVDFGDTPPRGQHALGNFLYVVHRGTFWEVNNAGVATNRGSLFTTTGRVYFADNGTTIMIQDGANAFTYNTSTLVFAQITDVDFPVSNTVTWLNQYFIVDKASSGRFYISAIGDPTNWSALDFANAEASPDNLVRVFADHGELLLFGELTIEPWGDSGAADFPFVRLGSSAIEWGLAARESLTKFDSSVMFLAQNRLGEKQLVVLNGYTPEPVGGQDFLRAINKYTTLADATAFSYMLNGHPFYQINFPTANASWLYDGKTKVTCELSSDTGRHRGNMGELYLGKIAVADYANGKVYRLDEDTYTDNGATIAREIISRHIFSDKHIGFPQLWIDAEVGVGLATGQGSNPQVMLSVSEDRGKSWGPEVWRSLGKIGEYLYRVFWTRIYGSSNSYSMTLKLRITDPVKIAIMGEGWVP